MTGAVGTAAGTAPATMPRIVQYARSPRYRTRLGAVFAGARRQEEGICVAALVTWTGLPLALWVAALGALAGALLGAFGFTPTGLASDLHLNESVGVLGALLGALGGLAAGFAVIYLIFFHSLAAFAGAVLSGLIVGSVTLWVLLVAEPLAMAARGYRELSRRESERLYPLLQRAGARMGLSVVPALWISDSQKPAAWSHPGAIVVTRGLLGEADASEAGPRSDLDDGALGAILAHELHHWAVGDPVGLRAVWACCWPVVAIYNAAAWLRTRSGVLGAVGWLLLWPAWLTVKLIVVPVMASASRQNEYEADWAAAGLGDDYRLGLRRALTELAVWEKPRTGWEDALAATHPPVELRLERLEAGYGTASAASTAPANPQWYAVNVRATGLPIRALTDKKALGTALDAHRAVVAYQDAYRTGDQRRIARAKQRSDRATRAFLDAVRAGLRSGGDDPKVYFPENRAHTVNITLPDVDVVISDAPVSQPALVSSGAAPMRAPAPVAATPSEPATVAPAAAPASPVQVAVGSGNGPKPQPAPSQRRAASPGSDRAISPPEAKPGPGTSKKPAATKPALKPPPPDDTGAAARWLGQPGADAPAAPKRRSSRMPPRS